MSVDERIAEIRRRITDYLCSGGLYNPELAIHDKVRDLLLDCRAALSDPQIRREVGGWRPIESAPKDGTAILLLYKGHAVEALWECVDSGDGESGKQPAYRWSSEFDFFGYGTEPTHWMPLPEPPEGK